MATCRILRLPPLKKTLQQKNVHQMSFHAVNRAIGRSQVEGVVQLQFQARTVRHHLWCLRHKEAATLHQIMPQTQSTVIARLHLNQSVFQQPRGVTVLMEATTRLIAATRHKLCGMYSILAMWLGQFQTVSKDQMQLSKRSLARQ